LEDRNVVGNFPFLPFGAWQKQRKCSKGIESYNFIPEKKENMSSDFMENS
jgi:hypothetical protein